MQSVPITTNVSSNPIHGEVYSIQYYVIKFVSDLRQVSHFLWVLWFPPPIKLTANIYLKILLKVPLNIITLTPITLDEKFQKRNDFREFITSTSTRKTISQMLNKYVYIRPTVKRVQIMSTNVCQLVEDHAAPTSLACIACIFIDVSWIVKLCVAAIISLHLKRESQSVVSLCPQFTIIQAAKYNINNVILNRVSNKYWNPFNTIDTTWCIQFINTIICKFKMMLINLKINMQKL